MRLLGLHWFGSKNKHLPFVLPLLPRAGIYAEPFGGSAAVLLNRPRSGTEVYNDLNEGLAAFLRTLRDDTDRLLELIDLTPHSRSEYSTMRKSQYLEMDPVERARIFYCLSKFGLSGQHSFGRRIGGNGSGPRHTHTGMRIAARRLRGVTIENRDALDVIREYDSDDTLFYLDPPHTLGSRLRSGFLYEHEYDDDSHEELADLVRGARGRVAVSGYDSPLYEKLYRGWRTASSAPRKIAIDNVYTPSEHKTAVEKVWMNY